MAAEIMLAATIRQKTEPDRLAASQHQRYYSTEKPCIESLIICGSMKGSAGKMFTKELARYLGFDTTRARQRAFRNAAPPTMRSSK